MLAAAGAMLSWPAIWNGAPLVFFDSASYISRADAAVKFISGQSDSLNPHSVEHGGITADRINTNHNDRNGISRAISTNPFFWRPIFYSIFLIPFATRLTFVLIPLGQGMLAAYVVRRLLVSLGVRSASAWAAAIGALAVASSLPWHVSYVMPDLFTGLVIAFSFVMVSSWRDRAWAGRVWDVMLLAAMISIHLSHIPLAIGLIGLYAAGGWLLNRNLGKALKRAGGLAGVVLALATAMAGLVASNLIGAHKATLSESSPLFLMARLVGDGPALDYLKQACPTRRYVVCDPKARLEGDPSAESAADFFLWSEDGAVQRLGSPQMLKEASQINSATLRTYPVQELQHMLQNAGRQLVTFQTDRSLLRAPPDFVVESVSDIHPSLARRLEASGQAKAVFPLNILDLMQNIGLAAAVLVIAGLALFARDRIAARAWSWTAVCAIGLLGNAIVAGALSSVHDRYQNRVTWLVVMTAVTLAFSAFGSRRRQAATSD